jgi:hypothetical protein
MDIYDAKTFATCQAENLQSMNPINRQVENLSYKYNLMFTFKLKPFITFLMLFIVEVGIALWIDDAIIRPFFGDFLAVIALFFLLKTFLVISDLNLAFVSLSIAYFLEFLQYCNFLKFFGLEKYKIIAIILGSSFDWRDIFAYTLGIFAVFIFDKKTLGLSKS